MQTKLNCIKVQDWVTLGRQANWSVSKLAKITGANERTLRRHFTKEIGTRPKEWLTQQRQKLAVELLLGNTSVKETGLRLGYARPETFSREFKKQCGKCPGEIAQIAVFKYEI